jgi:hypothetical protein
MLATDTTWWTDDVWVADSTPVECGRSRETTKRSALAGWAADGYCASHSRYFWGLRLHLVCTLHGLPVGFALAGANADERQVLLGILAADPALVATRPGQTLIADKHYYGRGFQAELVAQGVRLLRPARKGEPQPAAAHLIPAVAAGHRVDQPDLQGPAGSGTPRRPHPGRRRRAGAATHPRPDRRDLAQRPHRPADRQVPARLRPLIPLGIDHLAAVAAGSRPACP